MTAYLGSKADHADELLKIILAKRKPGQHWVEPFVGGANVISRVPDADGPRLGSDINPYMIAMHTALANGWEPPSVMDEKTYIAMKKNPQKYPPELVGFVGTVCAFGKMWFSTFARDSEGRRNYCDEGRRLALKDAVGMCGAKFICSSYDTLDIPSESLLYLDPPYAGTTGYDGANQKIAIGEPLDKNIWRANKLWQWADKMVDEGHTVFVSEYTGPSPEIYKTPPQSTEHAQVMAQFRALQADLRATETSPPNKLAALEELGSQIKDHEAKRRDPCVQMAARWKVVWSKEVKVTVARAKGEKGEENKTETEKLFHREA